MDKSPSAASIWQTLTKVSSKNISTEKFGGITYVKWMAAHAKMMDHFPDYSWEFLLDDHNRMVHYYPDKTCEVRCKMTVGGTTHITTLPVYTSGNKPKPNPNAHEINTAKQRCRVKAMAEFGLFQDMWSDLVYEGEEVSEDLATDPEPAKTDDELIEQIFMELLPDMLLATGPGDVKTRWNQFTNRVRNAKIEASEEQLKPWKQRFAQKWKAQNKSEAAS